MMAVMMMYVSQYEFDRDIGFRGWHYICVT